MLNRTEGAHEKPSGSLDDTARHPGHSGLYRASWESSGDGDHSPLSGLPCLQILQSDSVIRFCHCPLERPAGNIFHALICSKEVIMPHILAFRISYEDRFYGYVCVFHKIFNAIAVFMQYCNNTSFSDFIYECKPFLWLQNQCKEDANSVETAFLVQLLGTQPSLVIPHSGDIAVHSKLGKLSRKSILFQLETWNGMVK